MDGAAELTEVQPFMPAFVALGLRRSVSQGQKGKLL